MDRSRGRRRQRKHVEYDDVVPSTDLPPLVEGELRCFLFVTIGELVWGTTTTSKVPPASPVYIRLRWWGEASNGTYFRPQSKKLQQTVKCRAQFGIRSGPTQIAAYFNDMGSATFDVLSSPTSLPIGRVLVPGVSSLSSSHPIRGYFPIISASSRKLGELQISMSFKPVKAAYEETSDAMTDGSFSARSRNASLGGYGSRRSSRSRASRSSRSRASSVNSTKSRSSSKGSRASRSGSNTRIANGRTTSSGGRKKEQRSRSRSTDSKASLEASRHEIATPRGIDALLERNGHNLYRMNKDLPNENKENQVPIKTTVSITQPTDNVRVVRTDAISELLARGRKLREELSRSRAQDPPNFSSQSQPMLPPELPSSSYQIPHHSVTIPHVTTTVTTTSSAPVLASYASPPASQQRRHSSLKLVDMLFKGSGVKTTDVTTPDISMVNTPQYSMVSDSDDPLHDESILQQLFYTNTDNKAMQHNAKEKSELVSGAPTQTAQSTDKVSGSDLTKLGKTSSKTMQVQNNAHQLKTVTLSRVSIHGLQLAASAESEDDLSRGKRDAASTKQDRGRRAKPPMSASGPQTSGRTFFVEYKFPHTVPTHKSIAMTSSNHEVSRVASRRVSKNGLVKFDQHSVFNIHFNPATISKWKAEKLEFVVYQKRPKDKKASNVGCGAMSLKQVLNSPDLSFSEHLRISPKTSDEYLNAKVYGVLKVTIDLIDDSKDLTMLMSPSKKIEEVPTPLPHTITRAIGTATNDRSTPIQQRSNSTFQDQDSDSPRVCLVTEESTSDDNEICPRIASSVLYLYILLDKARNIPATKLQSGPSVGKCSAPNVYMVCRTFATDDASTTAVSWNSSNPKFGFTQVIPVKINNQLFSRLRNNFVVIEVWTKVPSDKKFSDKLLGLVKVPLQLFYQSLKDAEVARAVLKSEYPLVSVDGYQPVVDVFSGNERGQLKVLLALGTQVQVNALRKLKSSEDPAPDHHLDERSDREEEEEKKGDHLHSFNITVHGLSGFQPHNTQVWGETDCFVQYRFPGQRQLKGLEDTSDESTTTEEDLQDSLSMQCFRTDTTLCVPNPQFNYSKKHFLCPSPSMPVHKLLLSSFSALGKSPGGGVPFEVWSRFYYPNVRDQLLAKGTLPLAKLNAILTMTSKRVSEQSFHIPLEYADPDSNPRSAGDLSVTIKYKSSVGNRRMACQASLPFYKNVKLQIAVLRACGLKAAAKLKAAVTRDNDLEYCAEIGVNTYVRMNVSFLPTQKCRETRCIARSFAPDYNHHFEIDCPVLSYDDVDLATCLAAQLATGEITLEVWHKPVIEDIERKVPSKSDILLGRIHISTCGLLYKTTGCNGWYSLTSIESLRQKSSSMVGAVEVAMSFSCRSDIDLILRAAKSVSWTPAVKSDLSRLLVPSSCGTLKPIEDPDSLENFFTTCLTVTNAWLPKKLITFPGSEEINKHAHIYLRYKFYDKDTVVSSICPVASASERKSFKQHDVFPVKLAHRKSFLFRATQPLVWYLREETLEIQVWLSYSRSSRTRKRPFESDKLLGTALIDLSSILIGGLHRQQHVSSLYPMFKAGSEDMGDAAIRVYLSVSPGDHTQSYNVETLDDSTTSSTDHILDSSKELDQTLTCENEKSKKRGSNRNFSAIVSVERAMHLNSLPSSQTETRSHCYVTYPVAGHGSKAVEATKEVTRSSCPVWNDAKEVVLDRKILDKDCGNLLFRVWQRDEDEGADQTLQSDKKSLPTSDKVIGFATVDISVLQAGFRAVNGWYNIFDIHGHCQGQIKLAITPTEPLYGTSRSVSNSPSCSKVQLDQVSPKKSILHSVPLLGPVETPSGSMYYPGVAASGKVCESIGSLLDDVITSLPITTLAPATSVSEVAPSKNTVSVDSMPRLAKFQHDSPSVLQSVLQRQMKELDEIKEAFSQKRFLKVDNNPNIQTVYTSASLNNPSSTAPANSTEIPLIKFSPTPELANSSTKPLERVEVSSSSSSNSTSSATNEVDVPPPSGIPVPRHELDSSTPDRSKNAPTVHLSLFKPDKDRISEFDGAVLSDSDLSDVEFVHPVNLNDNSCLFPSAGVAPNPFPIESTENLKTSDQFVVSPEPPGSSSQQSELNNTSLWLSSTSQVETAVAAEQASPNENSLEGEDAVTPKILPISGLDRPVPETNDDSFLVQNDLNVQFQLSPETPVSDNQDVPPNDNEDETILGEMEKSHDSIEPDGTRVEVVKDDSLVESQASNSDTSDKFSSRVLDVRPVEYVTKNAAEGHDVLLDDEESDRIMSEDESSSSNSEESETEPPKFETPSVVLHQRDAVNQPSSSSSVAARAPQEWSSIPSFFPPRQDLLASMKTLQAITTEQKRKLLKQEDADNKENSYSAVQQARPRRKLMKPSAHTNEQTERLARIFSTKFN